MLDALVLFSCFLYAAFLLSCLYFWKKIPLHTEDFTKTKNIKTAIIIPARNEAQNLPALLKSLFEQDYPKELLEIIIVDDHSTDKTVETAENYFQENKITHGKIVRNSGHSKKQAITFAISQTEAEFIVTTDADTTRGKSWISSLVREYSGRGSLFICGPLKVVSDGSLFGKLQTAETIGLGLISAASIEAGKPMMCNGANLAFSKKVFEEVNGYEGSKSVSGDDTQLLLKVFEKYPDNISWLKDEKAIVETLALKKVGEAFSQRRRWASKIPTTLSLFTVLIAFLAWIVHALLLMQILFVLSGGGFFVLILALLMKIVPEIVLLTSGGKFYGQKTSLLLIILSQPVYILYIFLTGILLPFGNFTWKERPLR